MRWRTASGSGGVRLLFALVDERKRWAGSARTFDFITKWHPRCQAKAAWMAWSPAGGTLEKTRTGKPVGSLDHPIRRLNKKAKRYRVKPGYRPRQLKAISLPRQNGEGSGA